jgi:MFS family permease
MNTYIGVFVVSGIIQFALWLNVNSFALACVFACLYGLIAPGYLGLMPQIVVTIFGPHALASNTGILLLFNGPGNLIAGPLGGALFDVSGRTTWKWMIITMGSIQILGGLICCWGKSPFDRVPGADGSALPHVPQTLCQDLIIVDTSRLGHCIATKYKVYASELLRR